MKKYGIMLGKMVLFIGIYYLILQLAIILWRDIFIPRHSWFSENLLGVIVLNDVIALLIFYLTFRYILKLNFFKEARFYRMDKYSILLTSGVGLMAGIFTAMFASLPLIQSEDLQFYALFSYLNDSVWYVFLGFLLVGNLFKEVLFRALLFNELRKALPLVVAIIVQGLLYGVLFFNFDPPLTLFGFLGAVLFVLLYLLFNSIWAPILAQIFCQGIQYILWHSSIQMNNILIQTAVMILTGSMILYGLYLAKKNQKTPILYQGISEQEQKI